MAGLVLDREFWSGRRVLVTGHSGFKGSWLTLLLHELGAEVTGYSLEPPTNPSLFAQARLAELVAHNLGDVRDGQHLRTVFDSVSPDIVIHLAAQPLVRVSYVDPVNTFAVNLMGTVQVLECCRDREGLRAVVLVTSDKCYDNQGHSTAFVEADRMGGADPYSASKGCAELAAAAYMRSFFSQPGDAGCPAVATVRAGNVIGGGDAARDRLIPDIVRSLINGRRPILRNPRAVRPWQHVLEPLAGYLKLTQALWHYPADFTGGWNFGPEKNSLQPVCWIADRLCQLWGWPDGWEQDNGTQPHEDHFLALDSSYANRKLNWRPVWSLDRALSAIVEWAKAVEYGGSAREICQQQIVEYLGSSVASETGYAISA